MNGSNKFARLPKNVVPSFYNLVLTVDTEKEAFSGEELITVQLTEPTTCIFLHSVGLNFSAVSISQGNDSLTPEITYLKEQQGVELKTEGTIESGSAYINITYDGKIPEEMFGFYKTTYNHEGETIKCAVTDFEPAYARYLLPCFDEPDFKSVFSISVIARPHETVLSNMPITETKFFGDNLLIRHFEDTPKMSTYLLAVIVGRYDFIEEMTPAGTRVRVYTSVGKSQQGRFALSIALQSLTFYSEYFNYPFILPKCDLIAISDFATSAMENWGLITFRETALLASDTSSESVKQRIAVVVAHELAHMWFGNLVTMDWWTFLWLNEGFATWISYLCVDHIFPQYDIWTQFQVREMNVAMDLDSLQSSHPIEVPVGSPAEAEEMFDRISYAKGSSVIRYLHQFLGDEVFRDGLRRYVAENAFGNTVSGDLWRSLSEISGFDIAKLMECWISSKGFPYLSVSLVPSADDCTRICVEQRQCSRFTESAPCWQIPYNLVTQSSPGKVTRFLMTNQTSTVNIGGRPGDWVKLNVGNSGFYRVNYVGELRDRIIQMVISPDGIFSARDKVGLLGDFLSLASIGELSLVDGIRLCWNLRGETDYYIWSAIWGIISTVNNLIQNTQSYPPFRTFVGRLISSAYDSVGWTKNDSDDGSVSMLRTLLFEAMVLFGDNHFHSRCREAFDGMIHGDSVNADIQTAVIRSVLLNSTNFNRHFDLITNYYAKCDSEQKSRILLSLGYVDGFVDKIFEFSRSDAVKGQDLHYIFAGLADIENNCQTAWDYFSECHGDIAQKLSNPLLVSRIIPMVTNSFKTDRGVHILKNFFSTFGVKSAERCVCQCIERAQQRVYLLSRNYEDIKHYLLS